MGGFTDQLGTAYWGAKGPKAAPEVLCAPGSHYLGVKTNKGGIIAVIGQDAKVRGGGLWICNVLISNPHFEYPWCSLAAVMV